MFVVCMGLFGFKIIRFLKIFVGVGYEDGRFPVKIRKLKRLSEFLVFNVKHS